MSWLRDCKSKAMKAINEITTVGSALIGQKKKTGKKGMLKMETMPSPMGIRVEPRIADDLKVSFYRVCALTSDTTLSFTKYNFCRCKIVLQQL